MFRFVSQKNPVNLKNDYLKEYNVPLLQGKLDKLMIAYPYIKAILPGDISARKLLIADFKYLTKVYCAFVRYIDGKTSKERGDLLDDFKVNGFNYDSHKRKIARFLMNPSNGFEIHNCVYCDLVDVTSFTKADGNEVRKFKTEHVLDKGECPLVALSLYNFVPSCETCNAPNIKGTKTIGDIEEDIAKLSPTSNGYDFSEQVSFEVNMINPLANDLDAVNHPNDYEIGFNVRKSIYQKSITLFELKARYNNGIEKKELLKWREKRRSNPDNIVRQFAEIRKITFGEMFEEMFELSLRRKGHNPMEKARREVMLMF